MGTSRTARRIGLGGRAPEIRAWGARVVIGAVIVSGLGSVGPIAPATAVVDPNIPSITQPSTTEPPVTEPPVTVPPTTDPPVTVPPTTAPPTSPVTPEPSTPPEPVDPEPVDPAPTEPPVDPDPAAPTDSAEIRGENGGLVSDSPGPSSAKPWDGSSPVGPLTNASGRPLIGDNYPNKYKQYPLYPVRWDEWNFAHRQCTSFVSWRLNTANKINFSNQYGGLVRWGNASQWGDSARSLGIRVDKTPEVGAIAWSGPNYEGASEFGHVAWVADVLSDGRVVIEEYNYGWAGAYNVRTIKANAFQGYIHIADLTLPFKKKTNPTISGAPMVGSTLTASVSGWSPQPTSYRYRWMRDGVNIAGATQSTYQPKLADFGKRLTVQVTGDRKRYKPTVTVSASTALVQLTDGNGNGIDDTQEMLPWNSDVNGDGLPDIVGFGSKGVQVALASKTGFGATKTWVSGFGTSNGWNVQRHPRALVDVNGDGKSDVVGFAEDGVYVALSTGSGFSAMTQWSSEFGAAAGWSVQHHPRSIIDVNGDGRADILAFASNGVYVALNRGTSFGPMKQWRGGFGTGNGWTIENAPRQLIDMNRDGLPDIVGFSKTGVIVALNTGTKFGAATRWSSGFARSDGWTTAAHPRTLADVNGDGRPDAIGFASNGVYVALNRGTEFGPMQLWRTGFGTANGWLVGKHPRVLADVNGDGKADLVGFNRSGVLVALSNGRSFDAPARWTTQFSVKSWAIDKLPRFVTDVNGDGRADIVGFSNTGMRIATSNGKQFSTATLGHSGFGFGPASGSWKIAEQPRWIGANALGGRPVPKIAGQVRVGETITATPGSWYPKPVKLTTQWLRDGKVLPRETGLSYTLTPADLGAKISFRVRAVKLGYAPASRSSASYKVAPGIITSAKPRVTGVLKSGRTLKATPGTWKPQPVSHTYQWSRNGSPIKGATKSTYKLKKADASKLIRVRVTATKKGYEKKSRESASVRIARTR